MERPASIRCVHSEAIHLCCHVVQRLCPKEEGVLCPTSTPNETHRLEELGMRGPRAKPKVSCASLRVQTPRHSNGFEQCRLPRAVLTHKESDTGVKFDGVQALEDWQLEEVLLLRLKAFPPQGD